MNILALRGLVVSKIPIGKVELRRKVESLRRLIDGRNASKRAALDAQAREVYDLLIRPAETSLSSSERVLINPDGPLNVLPVAALMRSDKQYLAEWKPIHTVVSATVYAELKKMRREWTAGPTELTAFGAPRYPASDHKNSNNSRRRAAGIYRGWFDLSPSTLQSAGGGRDSRTLSGPQ
jgi:CHAT domain-containing protein